MDINNEVWPLMSLLKLIVRRPLPNLHTPTARYESVTRPYLNVNATLILNTANYALPQMFHVAALWHCVFNINIPSLLKKTTYQRFLKKTTYIGFLKKPIIIIKINKLLLTTQVYTDINAFTAVFMVRPKMRVVCAMDRERVRYLPIQAT